LARRTTKKKKNSSLVCPTRKKERSKIPGKMVGNDPLGVKFTLGYRGEKARQKGRGENCFPRKRGRPICWTKVPEH